MRRRSPNGSLLLAVGVSVTLAACGTTLPESEQARMQATGDRQSGGAGVPAGPPAGAGRTTRSAGDQSVATGTPNSAPEGGSSSQATPGAATQPVAGQPNAEQVDYTRPATGSPVEVGYMYIADLDGFASAFGGVNPLGNQQAMFNVVADYMNAHGGLGGHEVVLVPYGAEIAGSKTYAQSEQEACAHWTEDHDVVAVVVAEIGITRNLVECLNKAEVMFVTLSGTARTTAEWMRYRFHTTPMEVPADVLGRNFAEFVVRRGVVTSGDAIGVLSYDHPANREAVAVFRARAESLGLTVVAYEVHTPGSTPDIANSASQLPAAVLAMKSADAKAVVSLCTGCMNLYMQQAEQQRYYPRYVFSSYDNVRGLPNGRDPKVLDGATVLAWSANADVNLYDQPEIWTNETYELCRKIQEPNNVSDVDNLKVTQSICGSMLLVHESARAYGGTDITGRTLIGGKNRIGTSWPSTSTFTPLLSAQHAGAASEYRTMTYDRAQEKFVYDSSTLYPFR